MSRRPTLTLAATTALLAGLLSACGSSDHNEADVTFAQQMVPHHEQAVTMSDLALEPDRAASAEVRQLAEQIGSAQDGEIELMHGWLEDWDASEDEGHSEHGGGHGGDHDQMEGMLSDEQLADLEAASGAEFDTLWLTSMIEHHEGAVAMAQTVIADGKDPDVRTLAEQIVTAQESEIEQMQALLG